MIKRLLPFLALLILFVVLSVASPSFLTSQNLSSVVRQTAVFNILALGMTLIIISSGIDLSVGSIVALGGLAGTMAMAKGMPIPIGVLLGIATGFVCGFINGMLITQLRIIPFIVTLGMMGVLRGFALIISDGMPVHDVPKGFQYLGEGTVLGFPFVLLVLIVCAVIVHFILEHTRLGRYVFAIGSNPDAAIYAGIPVNFHTVAIYALCGGLSGLAGLIEASRLSTGQPTAGQGYELQAIAAVVIGGGSLRGGEGTVIGTLVGGFIMGLLANGSDLLGINPYVQQALIGAMIIVFVAVDELRKRKSHS